MDPSQDKKTIAAQKREASYYRDMVHELQYVSGITDEQIKELEKESDACRAVLEETKSTYTQVFGFGQGDWVYHSAAHFEKSNFKSMDTSRL